MDEIFIVKEIEQLKGLTDPLRLAVLGEAMNGPVTIARVAERLSENPRKLYYHFTELERLGLIRVVETRQKGNLIEKWFEAVARFISVDWTLFHHSPEGRGALAESITAMLHNSALDFQRRIQEGNLDASQIEQVWPLHRIFHLRPDQIPLFRERMRAVLEEFRPSDDSSDAPNASLTLLFYPFSPKSKDADQPGDVPFTE